jgi:formiminotetrahydrofolate cyclodeaminase
VAKVVGLDLKAFVQALGADAPAPGAGAAAAAALGMAAACAAKAFVISARHTDDPALSQAADRAREIALLALAGADWDAEDYPAVLHHRPGAEEALRQDGDTALVVADALAALLEAHGRQVIQTLAGDLAAARALLAAADTIIHDNLAELTPKN